METPSEGPVKRKRVAIYLAPDELAQVEEAAWNKHMKRAEFMRHAVLHKAGIVNEKKK
jgi:uncharacterized protein (DUF1778 family)